MYEVTEDDKLWAAFSIVVPLVGIIMLLMDEKKHRPFIRYHAVQSILFAVAFTLFLIIISTCTFGFGSCLFVLYFVVFYWAYQAYQGEWVIIPGLTDFAKNQGWI